MDDPLEDVSATTPSTGLLHLPPTFLDAVVPGYSVLARTLLTHAGIDLSFYVSVAALLFAALTAYQVTVSPAVDRLFSYFTSTVIVDEHDSIFDHILEWLSSQKALQNHRILRAHTGGRADDEDEEDELGLSLKGSSDQIFNFNDFATQIPARYEPHSSTGFFRHGKHIFRISREADRVQSEYSSAVRDREKFVLTVVWRSTTPIKALIEEARELSFSKRTSMTSILRPTPKHQRGHGNEWQTVSVRPSRSMNTVVLDDDQKLQCVSDINEFLQAARWYSNRGIPYRRGYLFHGAPGCGKTSLSFALAGVFGLEIYCLSLSEITLTEEDLIMLFTALPQRCIVLLEDIDCAGVSRPEPETKKKGKSKKKKSASTSGTGRATNELTNAITISGLLNAIDGVATAEGRILIMTTNFPDKLDAALTRPGRIDMRIEFTLASRQQIKELFLRMYTADEEDGNKQPTKLSEVVHVKPIAVAAKTELPGVSALTLISPSVQSEHPDQNTNAPPPPPDYSNSQTLGFQSPSLDHLATLFSLTFPERTFSPAEIQGYLLMHKKSPEDAVRNIACWADQELRKKKTREDATTSEAAKVAPVNPKTEITATKTGEDASSEKSSAKDEDGHASRREDGGNQATAEATTESTQTTKATDATYATTATDATAASDATDPTDITTSPTLSENPALCDTSKPPTGKKNRKEDYTPSGSASDASEDLGSDSDSDSDSDAGSSLGSRSDSDEDDDDEDEDEDGEGDDDENKSERKSA